MDYGDPLIKDCVVHKKKLRLHFHTNSNSKLTMATAAAFISDNSVCKDEMDKRNKNEDNQPLIDDQGVK